MRVGIGYDSHKFTAGRKLILGGVEIPHPQGLAGTCDADDVTHALTDALLGAAAMGDIGRMFADTDPRWKNADSLHLLNQAYLAIVEDGFQFVQADITVIAERPTLAPYVEQMQEKLANALIAPASAVSVKAKTNEGMGFIGRGEAIAAIAAPTLNPSHTPRASGGLVGPDLV